mgnify:CR=1 FL=1
MLMQQLILLPKKQPALTAGHRKRGKDRAHKTGAVYLAGSTMIIFLLTKWASVFNW